MRLKRGKIDEAAARRVGRNNENVILTIRQASPFRSSPMRRRWRRRRVHRRLAFLPTNLNLTLSDLRKWTVTSSGASILRVAQGVLPTGYSPIASLHVRCRTLQWSAGPRRACLVDIGQRFPEKIEQLAPLNHRILRFRPSTLSACVYVYVQMQRTES